MKIAIYGIGNYALRLLRRLEDTKMRTQIMGSQQWDYSVVYFIESVPSQQSFYGKRIIEANQINWDDFDFLVVALKQYETILEYLKNNVKGYKNNKAKIVHSVEFASNMQQNAAVSPYTSCIVNGELKFLFDTMDKVIGEDMLAKKHTWSEPLIRTFFCLAQKYCGYSDECLKGKIFFDIGANIGTTAIFVKKIINPELRVIGIEAGRENYNLFRINCILNDVEDIETVEMGLSNSSGTKKYIYSNSNPGGSYVVNECEGSYAENISNVLMKTFDEFCMGRGINSNDIAYVWLDTEGAESEIIDGGMKTLSAKKVPLLQEYNPMIYQQKGTYDKYLNNMRTLYSNFIDVGYYLSSNIKEIKDISELEKYTEMLIKKGKLQTDLFFYKI